ncbi:MAG: head GIN domain-containing protein [Ferruginibacter sp.]
MNKIILLVSVMFTNLIGNAQKQFVVDPNAEMRSINGSFNKIKVSNAIDLYLSQADNESLAISASEDRYKGNIKTVVENNTLKIYYEGDRSWLRKGHKVKVYVSFKELDELEASGASDVVIAGTLKAEILKINLSGASDLGGRIEAGYLDVECSGASDINISGHATIVKIRSSGASDFKDYDFVTDNCTVDCSGASDVKITVNKELSGHASGASSVYYNGSAVLKDIQTSGSSKVNKKG